MKQLTTELSQNFIEYAAAVNSDRAIPDARTGLKPVAKRILYGAYSTGKTSNKPRVKCAYIVGDTLARLHPHGDTSVYGALVRLAQDWVMRYPLIDFYGNKGNISGDSAAAYRYTEARLSKLAEEGLLDGIKKQCVNFVPTFDDKNEEPETLPSIFPNLLCNPNTGIGVATACNWAPHNLTEVAQSIYDYLDGKEPTIPGPDFPTGGIIINKSDIPNILATGHGSIKIRGKYKLEDNNIVFYEIPYGVTIETILTEIGDLCEKEEIKGIIEIRDETNKDGIRIVIQTNGSSIEYIINQLFHKTHLQSSFAYNQIALVNKTPTELNYKDCIDIYVKHNIECIINESKFDLQKALSRKEIVDGLLKALEDIDNIIALIKQSNSAAAAKEELQTKYKFTDRQADAIVNMKLGRLAGLERMEVVKEQKELIAKIDDLKTLINDEKIQKSELKMRLMSLVNKFGDERKTDLLQLEEKKSDDERVAFVEPEKCVVVMTKGGLIKRIPVTNFRTQRKRGKGIRTQDEITMATIRTNTVDSLMIFTNLGKIYRLLVDDIPEATNAAKGVPIKSLINLTENETPQTIYSIYRDTDADYVFFATKKGYIKRTKLEDYCKTRKKTGIAAIGLEEDDEIVAVTLMKDEEVMLFTSLGKSIRFETKEMPISSRTSRGVKGINLDKNDFVVSALPLRNQEDDIGIFTISGKGKRVKTSEFTKQRRGGKGAKCLDKNEQLACGILVTDGDNVFISGVSKSICIEAKDIPQLSRTSAGAKIIVDNNIIKATKI